MSIAKISGYLTDDSGNGINGATAELYANGSAVITSSTTTAADADAQNGYWAFSAIANGLWKVKISYGAKVRWVYGASIPQFNGIVIGANVATIDSTGMLYNNQVPEVSVSNSLLQAISNTTWTSLTFDTEAYDTDTMHSTASNTSRLTATKAGKYAIFANVGFVANATGARGLRFRINGGAVYPAEIFVNNTGGSDATYLTISSAYAFSATDYVELQVYQSSGGSLNTLVGGDVPPTFGMTRVG